MDKGFLIACRVLCVDLGYRQLILSSVKMLVGIDTDGASANVAAGVG